MSRRLSQEEFIRRVMEQNEYVRNGEIEILGEYVNQRTPIKCKCYTHNKEWNAYADHLYIGGGCRLCGRDSANKLRVIPYDEFIKKVLINNNLVKNGQIEIRGEYRGMHTRIECKCYLHDIVWHPTAYDLAHGCGCPECAKHRIQNAQKCDHDQFVEKLENLNNGFTIIGTYVNSQTPVRFRCSKGHIWSAKPNSILNGSGCPVCAGRQVLVGYNDLFTTHPDIARLLKNPEDGYTHTYGSHEKVDFICPDCGNIVCKSIKDVCKLGYIVCKKCSDNISWPNKFARAILDRCNVYNIEYEWNPDWLKPYWFDNKFITDDGQIIVLELDGMLGHGKNVFGKKEKDTNGLERDKEKDKRAAEHHVQVIRIDCCYNSESRFEYVKQHILDSELGNILDLSGIDWISCNAEALSSLVVKSANLYNNGYAIFEIADSLGYCRATIKNWLKQATEIGLCQYDVAEARRRGRKVLYTSINQYTLDGTYVAIYNSMADASKTTDILYNDIWCCCKHIKYHQSAGGYLWFYSDDLNQPDKTKIISNNIKLM